MLAISAKAFKAPTINSASCLIILYINLYFDWISSLMSAASPKKLLNVLRGNQETIPPIWLMRQAGRYLPEYRALRAEKGGFLALAYDSDAACEITLQPIRRFGFDGAILFSDILVIPHAMGQDLWFETGEGPRLAPRLVESRLEDFVPAPERLAPVIDTVRKVSAALPAETTFLGFAGSPWTVATYMVHGQGSKDQAEARRMAHAEPERFGALIDAIIAATVDYLGDQMDAGVDAVQLFDSWAGSLSPAQFEKWVIAPNAEIVRRLKARNPNAVIIGFPKGAGGKLAAYAEGTGVDALGLDETVDPHWANRELPKGLPVQGNLDPLALIAGGDVLKDAVKNILSAFDDRSHIFNLGHGILPETPIENVELLLNLVRKG
jgi:uroporphyrinogen decarboxylase